MVIFSVLWEDALISLKLLPVIPIFHEVPLEETILKPTLGSRRLCVAQTSCSL